MQTIQGILLGVCFAAALGGIVHLLSPGGSTDRLLRLVVTLFILASAAVPLRAVRTQINNAPSAQMRRDEAVDAVLQTARTAIETAAKEVLEKNGCGSAQLCVKTGVQDGEVHALQFVITGVPAEKEREIAHEIFERTGEMPCMETGAAASRGG